MVQCQVGSSLNGWPIRLPAPASHPLDADGICTEFTGLLGLVILDTHNLILHRLDPVIIEFIVIV